MKYIKWYDEKGNIQETSMCYQMRHYKKFLQIYYYYKHNGFELPVYENIGYEKIIEIKED